MTSSIARLLLLVAASLAVGFFLYRSTVVQVGPGQGKITRYEWPVVDLDGRPVDLSEARGRPVFLNVWATWCPPCRAEMPSIIDLSRNPALQAADVDVILVSVDDDIAAVRSYAERTDLGTARILVAAGPPPREFSTSGIPATFLIDPDGQIVRSVEGWDGQPWDRPDVVQTLTALARPQSAGEQAVPVLPELSSDPQQ